MDAAKDLEKVISWILSEGMTSGAFVSDDGRTTSWSLTYGTPLRLEVSTSSLDISDVICSERKAVETLVDEFTSRHPAWRECKLWVTRHGKRKQLKPEMIERLAA